MSLRQKVQVNNMGYQLGLQSLKNLQGVHPHLRGLVSQAIAITTQDFSVTAGVRTLEQQKEYYAKGTSKTLNSKHLLQSDGYSHAVDLVPYVNGELSWDWRYIYKVASAMQQVAYAANISLIWGGVWDRELQQLGRALSGDEHLLEIESGDYAARFKKKNNRTAFLDGPHFELVTRAN